MCISPDGDFFAALRAGKADVVTGHIDTITDKSIKLKNGKSIDDIDIIITATGLKVQLCGNASLSIDGEPLSVGDKFVWRGAMLQDVPVRNHPFQMYNSNMKPRTSLSSSATPTPHGRSVQMPPSASSCD